MLGFENAEAYREAGGSFGALLGRYANRIDRGRFMLDGHPYQLGVNDAGNTLHGGPNDFGNALWKVDGLGSNASQLVLSHLSPDGDQGFPGTLSTQATYRLRGNTLTIELVAMTDRPTIINLSSHPYFNLTGNPDCDILSHEMSINAAHYLPTDRRQIPTGTQLHVEGSAFDFRTPRPLGAKIRRAEDQLLFARGYDHCFVLYDAAEKLTALRLVASAHDPSSGRLLKLYSTQPGLQLYSGNLLDGSIVGRDGIVYRQSAGFAIEAENFPDARNHPGFPTSVLRSGEIYHQIIAYEFSVQDQASVYSSYPRHTQ